MAVVADFDAPEKRQYDEDSAVGCIDAAEVRGLKWRNEAIEHEYDSPFGTYNTMDRAISTIISEKC